MGQNVLILKPGETVLIPSSVDINSIITEDGAVLESDCTNIPSAEDYVCIRYDFSDSSSPDPGALEDLTINYIEVGGTRYELNLTPGVQSIYDIRLAINNTLGAIFKVYSGSAETSFDDRNEYAMAVKVPESLKDSIIFNMSGTGYPNGFNLLSVDQEDCGCVNDSGKEEYYCEEDF